MPKYEVKEGRAFEFIQTDTRRVMEELQDEFVYRPEKGWKIIQRMAFRILRKIGAFRHSSHMIAERKVVSHADLVEFVWKQCRHAAYMENVRPEDLVVLTGPDEFEAVLRNPELHQTMAFQLRNLPGGYDGRPTLFNAEIVVLPWMAGRAVVVPKRYLS